MSGRDRLSRTWTHRRLGIGAEQISDHALAETDAMLSRIGARHAATSTAPDADPFGAALLDFAYDIDLVAGIASVDATPVASELLRLTPATGRARRLTWRVLIPAMSGGLAVLVVVLAMALSQSSSRPVAPSLSATAESRHLLNHANTLLAAAAKAGATQRARLVTEAKADLTHVTRLLPLAPPPFRSGLRQRLHTLNRQMRPLAPPPPAPKSSGDTTTGSGSGQRGSGRPVQQEPPVRQRPAQGVDSGQAPTGSSSQPTAPTLTHPPRPGSGHAPPPQRGGPSGPGQQPVLGGAFAI